MEQLTIAGIPVGEGYPTFLIVEIGQAHDGSLGTAHAYIDAVSKTGANAIKFQTHFADQESTLDEPFRVQFSLQDKTRYDYWKRMEFTYEQWDGLADHAREKGLIFLSSAFSMKAFEVLKKIGMPAWKVGSGEFKSRGLLGAMGETSKPIIYSTGMASFAEIEETVAWFSSNRYSFALLQCTTKYPTSFNEVGINVMDEFRRKFHCPVGLSDHSGSIYPTLFGMAKGAHLIEVHATFDRKLFGPDIKASLTMEEIKVLTEARDAFYLMNTHPVDKDEVAKELYDVRTMFTKSIALSCDLKTGMVLTEAMLIEKKPGTGIPLSEKGRLIGRRLKRDVRADHLLRWEDVETDE